jgi:hypothetical protein
MPGGASLSPAPIFRPFLQSGHVVTPLAAAQSPARRDFFESQVDKIVGLPARGREYAIIIDKPIMLLYW